MLIKKVKTGAHPNKSNACILSTKLIKDPGFAYPDKSYSSLTLTILTALSIKYVFKIDYYSNVGSFSCL